MILAVCPVPEPVVFLVNPAEYFPLTAVCPAPPDDDSSCSHARHSLTPPLQSLSAALILLSRQHKMSRLMTKPTKLPVHPVKTQIRLGIRPYLIRVFAVRMKKALVLSYPLRAQRKLIRPGGCPG